ncbi:Glycerol-3-phosphate-binding protein [Klebsiella pneumoniae ISC21]|nr:Glycerol-3-phosphate-binding protein [Klebsiella pneumoniae ISC21]
MMPSGVLNSKQISAAFFSGKLGMAMLSTGALGFMRENSKDFELGGGDAAGQRAARGADRRRQPGEL